MIAAMAPWPGAGAPSRPVQTPSPRPRLALDEPKIGLDTAIRPPTALFPLFQRTFVEAVFGREPLAGELGARESPSHPPAH